MKPLPRFAGKPNLQRAIEHVLRNSIVYNAEQFTSRGAAHVGLKWETVEEALSRCQIFNLVEKGGFNYEQLGVRPIAGALPAQIIKEHLIIRGIYYKAIEDKNKV